MLSSLISASIKNCIFSEITFVNEIIFKYKSPDPGSIFSLIVNESPFQDTFGIDDKTKGTIKLLKPLRGILAATESTKIISGQLRIDKNGVLFQTLEIKFYVLKEGFADSLLAGIIASIPTLARASDPFRQTSVRYPWYKKLHSIMMRGTRRSKAFSLAECKFVIAFKKLVVLILERLQGKGNRSLYIKFLSLNSIITLWKTWRAKTLQPGGEDVEPLIIFHGYFTFLLDVQYMALFDISKKTRTKKFR